MTQRNYAHHDDQIPRLNRVSGQIDGIRKMISENRRCPDILIQLRAARAALRAIESNILNKHLSHCVADAFAPDQKDEMLAELKKLFDRFSE